MSGSSDDKMGLPSAEMAAELFSEVARGVEGDLAKGEYEMMTGTVASAEGWPDKEVTLDNIKESISILDKMRANCPFRKMMMDEGFSPEDGYLLVLPLMWKRKTMRLKNMTESDVDNATPEFVHYSASLQENKPMVVKDSRPHRR